MPECKEITYESILKMSGPELVKALDLNYASKIPQSITTPEGMREVGELLVYASNSYTYLQTLEAYIDADVRIARNTDKLLYSELVGKRETLSRFVKNMEQMYQALSRLVSTRQAELKEIQMSG